MPVKPTRHTIAQGQTPRSKAIRRVNPRAKTGSASEPRPKRANTFMKSFNVVFVILTITSVLIGALGGRSRFARTPNRETIQEETTASLLTWKRENLSAPSCEQLTISRIGEVIAKTCKTTTAQKIFMLSATQLDQLQSWAKTYRPFLFQNTDPSSQDEILLSLDFLGSGIKTANQIDQMGVESFVEGLFSQSITAR